MISGPLSMILFSFLSSAEEDDSFFLSLSGPSEEQRPLTNIVCVLPDDVSLQKVISQHKSTFLHSVKQHGGCT